MSEALDSPMKLYYHSEIISEFHREQCYLCQTAFLIIKDLVKTASEEKPL